MCSQEHRVQPTPSVQLEGFLPEKQDLSISYPAPSSLLLWLSPRKVIETWEETLTWMWSTEIKVVILCLKKPQATDPGPDHLGPRAGVSLREVGQCPHVLSQNLGAEIFA